MFKLADLQSGEQRAIRVAMKRYLAATAAFEKASKDFSESCAELRAALDPLPKGFIAVFEGEDNIVEPPLFLLSKWEGNDFDVKQVELL